MRKAGGLAGAGERESGRGRESWRGGELERGRGRALSINKIQPPLSTKFNSLSTKFNFLSIKFNSLSTKFNMIRGLKQHYIGSFQQIKG
jgi:hypothetical protein